MRPKHIGPFAISQKSTEYMLYVLGGLETGSEDNPTEYQTYLKLPIP